MLKVGVTILTVGFIASIISTAIPYWYYTSAYHKGLWQSCIHYSLETDCSSFSSGFLDDHGWLRGCQALMIIGVVFLLFGEAGVVCHNIASLKASGLLSILGGICCLVAAIIYAVEDAQHLHAGFGLACLAAAGGIIGGAIIMKAHSANAGYSSI